MRVGIGHDTHRLVEGRRLILGGVRIDHRLGLQGHSDADVVCHAVADAFWGRPGSAISGSTTLIPIRNGLAWKAHGY